MDDVTAVASLQAGDIGGLEILVERYHRRAVQVAFLVLGDRSLAEDVAQNAFLSAYAHIGTFDVSRPFGPWFLRSVTNLAVRTSKGLHEEAAGIANDLEVSDPNSDLLQRLEAMETREQILRALRSLSPSQRAAVVMRYYLDFSDTEASQILHVPRSTFRRRLHDAHGSLRKLLAALTNHSSLVESGIEAKQVKE